MRLSCLLFLLSACARPAGSASGIHALADQEGAFTLWAPPSAADRPHGVLVLLHADDATPRRPTTRPRLRHLARDLGLVLVAPESPGPVDSGCWWSPHKHRRADYLVDLLEDEVFVRYEVDRDRVYLAGKSGGAFFATGIPFYRELPFQGGLVGVCGGDLPREESDVDWCAFTETEDDPPLAVDPDSGAAVAAAWPLFLAHTSGDEFAQTSEDAARLYTTLGAPVTHRITGPGGHCALDVVRWWVRGVQWVDAPLRGAPGD